MPKTAVPVDKIALIHCIEDLEDRQTFPTQSALFKAVAAEYNETLQQSRPVTLSIVSSRVREWGIEVKTPKGKRGASLGGSKRQSKASKFAASAKVQRAIRKLRVSTPLRFHHLVDKIESGSRTAAVRLHCISCSGDITQDVNTCAVEDCPLWAFRPYQKKQL